MFTSHKIWSGSLMHLRCRKSALRVQTSAPLDLHQSFPLDTRNIVFFFFRVQEVMVSRAHLLRFVVTCLLNEFWVHYSSIFGQASHFQQTLRLKEVRRTVGEQDVPRFQCSRQNSGFDAQ